jgi:hypothetical protein
MRDIKKVRLSAIPKLELRRVSQALELLDREQTSADCKRAGGFGSTFPGRAPRLRHEAAEHCDRRQGVEAVSGEQ